MAIINRVEAVRKRIYEFVPGRPKFFYADEVDSIINNLKTKGKAELLHNALSDFFDFSVDRSNLKNPKKASDQLCKDVGKTVWYSEIDDDH